MSSIILIKVPKGGIVSVDTTAISTQDYIEAMRLGLTLMLTAPPRVFDKQQFALKRYEAMLEARKGEMMERAK